MSVRRPLSRLLLGGTLLGGGALALVGGLALRGPGLIGVGLAATLAGCTAAGVARESPTATRGSAVESAVSAAGWTAGAVFVVAGVATVAGGAVAAVVVVAGLIAFLVVKLLRGRGRLAGADVGARTSSARGVVGEVRPTFVTERGNAPEGREPAGGARQLPPVRALTTRELGDEWRGTTAALAGRLDTAARERLVARRQETLDELERRDADGFARWLAAEPVRASDPADFVRGGPVRRGPVPDTDAA